MYWNEPHLPFATLVLLGLFASAVPAQHESAPMPQIRGQGQCRACHALQDEDRLRAPTFELDSDLHARDGLGCADCHGGDPNTSDHADAHDPEAGYIGVPSATEIPDLCARCHAHAEYMITQNPALPIDQYEKYWTSRHGQLLDMGLRKVAQCASCHTAHNVRGANDPRSSIYPVNLPKTCAQCHSDPQYMAGYPIPTDQFSKYSTSVHGQALLEREDLGAPACNDCHGNHGAVPPGVQSLSHVCGMCHAMNADLYEQSPHAEVFAIQELPQCVVCHGHHAIAEPDPRAFDMTADSSCIACHNRGDDGWETGKKMFALNDALRDLRAEAEEQLDAAQNLGMDVSDGRFLLQDFRKNYLQLRTVSHSLDIEQYSELAEKAREQAATAIEVAQEAQHEFHFRRQGLLVALLLSLPVVILLYVKIGQLDNGRKRRKDASSAGDSG